MENYIKIKLTFVASRAIHSQTSQEDADYDVITAYVMEDNGSVRDHNLHSGPPSIKVIRKRYFNLNNCKLNILMNAFLFIVYILCIKFRYLHYFFMYIKIFYERLP